MTEGMNAAGGNADTVLALDRLQNTRQALSCKTKDHGRLGAHGSGSVLMCGACEYAVQVTAEIIDAAAQLGR